MALQVVPTPPAYTHYPGLCAAITYENVVQETAAAFVAAKTAGHQGSSAKRISFVCADAGGGSVYDNLLTFDITQFPLISELRQFITTTFDLKIRYCLVHLYMSGPAGIAWHNDKEAIGKSVVSVSFGATREFRFRPLGTTRGYSASLQLASGDLVVMHATCQALYEHSIIPNKRITEPRINLTFRE